MGSTGKAEEQSSDGRSTRPGSTKKEVITLSEDKVKYHPAEGEGKLSEIKRITREMVDLYERKNADYGDSFAVLYGRFGLQSTVIRLWDKLLRLERLSRSDAMVSDETVDDTLIDIANYAVMTLAERRYD